MKAKTLATYEYLIKIPKDGDNSQITAMKCNHCNKFFESEAYLKKHYQKKHPEADFQHDFPGKAQVQK